MSDLTSTFDRNFYQEVREGYRGVVGQDVGQLHLEAPFSDRGLVLEFESGFFQAVKDRRAHDTFTTRRLGPSRYSAETYVEVLVAPVRGATVWSAPPPWRWWHPARLQWYVARSVG